MGERPVARGIRAGADARSVGRMMIADEAFLLFTTEKGGVFAQYRKLAVSGAVIADLILAERIGLDGRKDPRIDILDARPIGHPAHDAMLGYLHERIVTKGKKVKFSQLMSLQSVKVEELTGIALTRAGIVDHVAKRLGGLIGPKFPVVNPLPEQQLRARLADVLRGGAPTPADAVLLSILKGTSTVRRILKDETAGMSRKEVNAVIESLDTGEVGPAIKHAIDMFMVAVMTPVLVGAVTTSG